VVSKRHFRDFSRIRLDKELTDDDYWHPCFEVLDNPVPTDERVGGSDELCSNESILWDLIEPWIFSMKSLVRITNIRHIAFHSNAGAAAVPRQKLSNLRRRSRRI